MEGLFSSHTIPWGETDAPSARGAKVTDGKTFSCLLSRSHAVLLVCEALFVSASFLCATLVWGRDSYLVLSYEGGLLKIIGVSLLTLFCSYYMDLYAPQPSAFLAEIYFRSVTVVAVLSIILAGLMCLFPWIEMGRNVLAFRPGDT